MFDSVLVANRGEIAVRIISTLRRMGIRSVAVYSETDADAPHVRAADAAVPIGPAPASESYLNIDRIIAAARSEAVAALHPGYGFLSENPALAAACASSGIAFIGPSPVVITAMGDKAAAKRIAVEAGVPTVSGVDGSSLADDELAALALRMDPPVLIKPVAGGGGKGMRIARTGDDVPALIEGARREARKAFGDDRLIVERFIERARHVEVQVVGDSHGSVIHLGDRECSLQRRHQKVIEEAPAPRLPDPIRMRLADAAVALARHVDYVGVGTVEFIVPADRPEDFAFLEMNTRLQVEHPVTEAVTGVDLVEWQVRIAAGEPLPLAQDDVTVNGHAIEARVYAEDPRRGFLPATGTVLAWRPDPAIRWDAAVDVGLSVTTDYDPLLAKAVAWGPDRDTARHLLVQALRGTVLLGIPTNLETLRGILTESRVVAGDLETELLADILIGLEQETSSEDITHDLAGIAARCYIDRVKSRERLAAGVLPRGGEWGKGEWAARDAWSLGAARRVVLDVGAADARGIPQEVALEAVPREIPAEVSVAWDAEHRLWLHTPATGNRVLEVTPPRDRVLLRPAMTAGDPAATTGRGWTVRSPLPGSVVEIPVTVGAAVREGEVVVIVEAMKMEHAVRAPADGIVTSVHVDRGQQVRLDAELASATSVVPPDGMGEGSEP